MTRRISRICVFCGSSLGARREYAEAARRIGQVMVERGIGLVYGGASVGVMGEVADTVLAGGGEVIGVIPRALATKEVAHAGLADLRIVESMHERKAQMADLADGFVALPGGFGTLEEFFEVVTWAQLGIHHKPCGLLNAAGYFDRLVEFLEHSVAERFVRTDHRRMVLLEQDPARLIDRMEAYEPPSVRKWIEEGQR
jgi:uncharacterized protein (TIGR00730 family)